MLTSFIVIGYNVEKTIKRCLESIYKQTNENFEVIFVDDNSNDDTLKTVKEFQRYNDNLRVIKHDTNKGANAARKTGFLESCGEHVCFIDGDDTINTKYIEVITGKLKNDPSIDFISFNYNKVIDGKALQNEAFVEGEFTKHEYLNNILSEKLPHYIVNKIYKREFLIKMKFSEIPSITMGDDLAANVRMGIYLERMVSINIPLYNYYIYPESISHKVTDKHIEILTALKDVERSLSLIDTNYSLLIQYKYFRAYYSYVVRNSSVISNTQKFIKQAWKLKDDNWSSNPFIRKYISQQPLMHNVLFYIYNTNLYIGYYISRAALFFKR